MKSVCVEQTRVKYNAGAGTSLLRSADTLYVFLFALKISNLLGFQDYSPSCLIEDCIDYFYIKN